MRGTSAFSVIQGCWLGRRKVGPVLMEDTHGDKACSYGEPPHYGTLCLKFMCSSKLLNHRADALSYIDEVWLKNNY